jgi:RimJ/RimL family protein N-acetyltransferase
MDDAPFLRDAINNKNVLDNLRDGIPYPYELSDAEEYIVSTLASDKEETYAFAITLDDKAVGSIGVFRAGNIHSRTAEMGYYVAEPYWGRGIGTFAVREASDLVFGNSDILRIFAEPFADNVASCRVLEKAGFTLEGVLRSNAVKNGRVLDMKMYSKVREEI